MSVRDQLLQRDDVSADDIDDIIRLAGALRDESGTDGEGVSLSDASAQSFLESAIEQTRVEKLRRIMEEREQKERRNERVASGLLVVLMVGALTTGGGFVGSQAIADAAKAVKSAEDELDQLCQRELELVPVLMALDDSNDPQLALQTVSGWNQAAPQERAQSCSAFMGTMTDVLNGVQVADGSEEAAMLKSLRAEFAQLEQQTHTENAKLAAADEQWQSASVTLQGRLAIWLELAPNYGEETYFPDDLSGFSAQD